MDQIERIQEMERCLNVSRQAVDKLAEAIDEYEKVLKDLKKLNDYYGSTRWMKDYDDDEEGKLPAGMGAVYKKNARNIGELGIGLNPAAGITGNMLEDEKAFTTCHFAIGENYDNDAPSLIHLDGIVRNPTISLLYEDGTMNTIMDKGTLTI